MSSTPDSMLSAALAYAARGMPVFPCRPDKRPFTSNGFKNATTDPDTIRAFWTEHPGAMIGMPTGKTSELVVVDVDVDQAKGVDGLAAWEALVSEHGAPVTTRAHRTPRGGLHLLFQHPGVKVKSTTSALAAGIDTRGTGGYVILPPSRNGAAPYTVEVDTEPAPLPAWLIALFRKRGIMEETGEHADLGHGVTRDMLCKNPTTKRRSRKAAAGDAPSREKIEDALRHISADCDFNAWLAIGMALHNWNAEAGRALWDTWSASAPERYDAAAIGQHWRSFTDKPGGVTIATLFKRATENGWKAATAFYGAAHTAPAASEGREERPAVLLPHAQQSISETGHALGSLLARTERYFLRGGAVVRLQQDPDGLPQLEDVRPASLASDFEGVASLCKTDERGEVYAATCTEQTAKLIAASAAFRDALPPIRVLTRCPVLIERDGRLVQISGYDRESGIMAGGERAENMTAAEGRQLLCLIVEDFRFATPADRARALAAIITPALVLGGLLRARAPVDLGEGDRSQAGKGFKVKLKAAVYKDSVKVITQQRAGGVGSLEEAFNAALIRGACFISLDNVRGKIDSPAFESFLTEDHYTARAAFIANTDIDPRRVCIMLTSNKADVTTDLANRSSCVRILKQPDGYTFKAYPEGDILDHVRANQPRFLGAVFAIVQAWFDAGRPKTTETRHDFRPWAQTLDWMTRNLLDAGPLLDGHRETQARMTNPVLNWLRDVALEVIRARQGGAWLRAGDLVDLLAETTTETPGLPEHADPSNPETRKMAQQATGRKLGLCFRAGDTVTLDGMTIERREQYDTEGRYTVREYCVKSAAMESDPLAAKPTEHPETGTATTTKQEPEQSEMELCGYGAANGAASRAAMQTLAAANAADPSLYGQTFSPKKEEYTVDILTKGTISRIAAEPAPCAVEVEADPVELEERLAIQNEGRL